MKIEQLFGTTILSQGYVMQEITREFPGIEMSSVQMDALCDIRIVRAAMDMLAEERDEVSMGIHKGLNRRFQELMEKEDYQNALKAIDKRRRNK